VEIVQTRHGVPAGRQYPDYPEHFPRRPIALDSSVPSSLPTLIRKWDVKADFLGDKLSKNERQLLEEFFGHPIFLPRFMYHHQLGGEALYEPWDESAFLCPNKKCPGGVWDRLMRQGRSMKFLSGVLNDPPGGLPLIEPLNEQTAKNWNYFVSFYFQICAKCLTVTTYSTSD
jgi:hypothetical protein